MSTPRKKTSNKKTSKKITRRETGAGEAEAAAVLDLQRLSDVEDDGLALGGSGVSKSCSAGSKGCEIHCTPDVRAAPTPGGIE
jgi:hypothetical protein